MTSSIDPFLQAGAKSKGARPWFLKDGDVERVLNITMALAQEVSVLRERLDTVERLLERGDTVSKAAIDGFEPTREEAAERALTTQEFIARILRVIQQDREAIEAGEEMTSEQVGDQLAS
jgi:hypothetical protein